MCCGIRGGDGGGGGANRSGAERRNAPGPPLARHHHRGKGAGSQTLRAAMPPHRAAVLLLLAAGLVPQTHADDAPENWPPPVPEAPHHEARAAIRSAAIVYTPVSLDNSKSWLDNTPADVREVAGRAAETLVNRLLQTKRAPSSSAWWAAGLVMPTKVARLLSVDRAGGVWSITVLTCTLRAPRKDAKQTWNVCDFGVVTFDVHVTRNNDGHFVEDLDQPTPMRRLDRDTLERLNEEVTHGCLSAARSALSADRDALGGDSSHGRNASLQRYISAAASTIAGGRHDYERVAHVKAHVTELWLFDSYSPTSDVLGSYAVAWDGRLGTHGESFALAYSLGTVMRPNTPQYEHAVSFAKKESSGATAQASPSSVPSPPPPIEDDWGSAEGSPPPLPPPIEDDWGSDNEAKGSAAEGSAAEARAGSSASSSPSSVDAQLNCAIHGDCDDPPTETPPPTPSSPPTTLSSHAVEETRDGVAELTEQKSSGSDNDIIMWGLIACGLAILLAFAGGVWCCRRLRHIGPSQFVELSENPLAEQKDASSTSTTATEKTNQVVVVAVAA